MTGFIGRLVRSSALLAASNILIAVAGIPAANAAPVLLPGYQTHPSTMAIQPQWQRLLSTVALHPDSAQLLWQDLHNAAIGRDPMRQLDMVNRHFNEIRYGTDTAIYGASDYWAAPAEFIARDFGDCEDYSIAKYTALRALGWRADDLFIVVVRDIQRTIGHAVLAAKIEDRWYFLDNLAMTVRAPAEIPYYQPIYALNETQSMIYERSWPTRQTVRRAGSGGVDMASAE